MSTRIESCGWPLAEAGAAVEALALPGKGRGRAGRLAGEKLRRVSVSAAADAGLEAEALKVDFGELEALMRCRAPWLATLPTAAGPRLIAVVSGGARRLRLLGPDLRVRTWPQPPWPRRFARPPRPPICRRLRSGWIAPKWWGAAATEPDGRCLLSGCHSFQ